VTTIKRRLRAAPAVTASGGVVFGIDQSYSGFAICGMDRVGKYEVYRRGFEPKKFGTGVDRLVTIASWVTEILEHPGPVVHVCMEGYAPNSKFGREIAGELGAVVKVALRLHPNLASPVCYPTIVATTKLKKFVSGKGSGSGSAKSDMKLNVYKQWGVSFADDNEADAYGLAKMAAALVWPDDSNLLGYQLDVMKDLRQYTER
jgi:hypothetical protein